MAARRLDAVFLPSLVAAEQLRGQAVVLIDVLRATSTIVTALCHGAVQVIPCAEIEQAREMVAQFPPRGLLGGERKGLRIEGFDLGNSPLEYTPAAIGGRTILLATTNGTPAIQVCREAEAVWIASFANVQAIAEKVRDEPHVTFLCAGTDRRITGEDVLLAGCAIERCLATGSEFQCDDQAALAVGAWRDASRRTAAGESLADILAHTHGGRNLVKNGLRADIDYCAVIDRFDVAPRFDPVGRSIRLP